MGIVDALRLAGARALARVGEHEHAPEIVILDKSADFLDRLTAQSTLGADLAAYFWTDAYSGKFVVLGLFMIMVGVVSHSARRAGRREQEVIDRGRRF